MIDLSGGSRGVHVFGLPPGANFAACLVAGLKNRLAGSGPEDLARVTIITNTRRSARAMAAAFAGDGPTLLPKIVVVDDLASSAIAPPAEKQSDAVSPLRAKLLLAHLIREQASSGDGPLPLDLAESLRNLLAEAQGEGVDLKAVSEVIAAEYAAHRIASLELLDRALPAAFAATGQPRELRQRLTVKRLIAHWREVPPRWPVLVAGSTGSRGPTALLMQALARSDHGAVILPGYDFDMPSEIWGQLQEDHPQFRFAALAREDSIGFDPAALPRWDASAEPSRPRNRIVSVALRPAPVTDNWISALPELRPLAATASAGAALLLAPDSHAESVAVAVALRRARAEGKTCALVTPDRLLARRVAAQLARWKIRPDDSAGMPLALTPPGIFLRLTAPLLAGRTSAANLLALLKHPLCGGAGLDRAAHRDSVFVLERKFLRGGPPEVDAVSLEGWLAGQETVSADFRLWTDWLLAVLVIGPEPSLAGHVSSHGHMLSLLARGAGSGEMQLWDKQAGSGARAVLDRLQLESPYAGTVDALFYAALLNSELARAEDIRDEAFVPDPGIAIWGTLEARIQSADVVVLGGLNEGIWPGSPAADPWLNRATRQQLGLPLPERKTGLSAHDFQQAAAAREVVFSRALRDGEAPTVASRWLVRLSSLLGGIGEEGSVALQAMRDRGDRLLALAKSLDHVDVAARRQRAQRPAPCPPLAARPQALSVTQVETLIRDPYAIYAAKILHLRKLDPLGREPDYRERGSALHRVMEAFVRECPGGSAAQLVAVAERVLEFEVPWPETRRWWLALLRRSAEHIVLGLGESRKHGTAAHFETRGEVMLHRPNGTFTLNAKADRIDLSPDGSALIYDYKSGAVPKPGEITSFAKQLLLEAAIAESGGFTALGKMPVSRLEYVTLAAANDNAGVDTALIAPAWEEFLQLLAQYENPSLAYPARIRANLLRFGSDFDHLSRLGEWADGDPFTPEIFE